MGWHSELETLYLSDDLFNQPQNSQASYALRVLEFKLTIKLQWVIIKPASV